MIEAFLNVKPNICEAFLKVYVFELSATDRKSDGTEGRTSTL